MSVLVSGPPAVLAVGGTLEAGLHIERELVCDRSWGLAHMGENVELLRMENSCVGVNAVIPSSRCSEMARTQPGSVL